ncbi:MAG: glycogen synthase GlgA [Nitrospinota bacterium]|nr:glycogen synthase GlgA [Nitrospinota bacterium]
MNTGKKQGRSRPLDIVMVTSEATPWAKTGGLGDVAGALPQALAAEGNKVRLFLPLYKSIDREKYGIPQEGLRFRVPISARIMEGRAHIVQLANGLEVWFIAQDEYFGRDGIYLNAAGHDFADNLERFAFFCRGVLEALVAMGRAPDIIHCNDWQSALIPAYLNTLYYETRLFKKTKSMVTIHNMGYQGRFHPMQWHLLGLPWDMFHPEGLEAYGAINMLKGGLVYADMITTVSPTYSLEILTPEGGFGLDGLLRRRVDILHGVLNGIDTAVWDPSCDPHLPAHYSQLDMSGKKECKRALERELSLTPGPGPLLGVVSRLADGKGMDILADSLEPMLAKGARLALLGSGDKALESRYRNMAASNPGQVAVIIGYDEGLSHRIQGGSDILLVPSRYEPCGLTQMYALAYGTAPLARATGGLNDTVRQFDPETQTGNGFKFEIYSADMLLSKTLEAMEFFVLNPEKWNKMVSNGMKEDNSWAHSAKLYIQLYRSALKSKKK